MQIQGTIKHNRRTLFFWYGPFINFWLRFFDAGRETILKSLSYHTMLTRLQRSAHLVVQSQFLNTMVGTQLDPTMVLNIIVGPQLQLTASMADNPTVFLHGSKSNPNWLFFKSFKFSEPSLPGIHTPAHFLSRVYYDNCDCHILCARA